MKIIRRSNWFLPLIIFIFALAGCERFEKVTVVTPPGEETVAPSEIPFETPSVTPPEAAPGEAVDTISPTVSSTDPSNAATGVTADATVVIVFSEPMGGATIVSDTFTLKDSLGRPVAGTVGLSEKTATFTPSAKLGLFTAYTATITTRAKDIAGNELATDYSWTFTTRDGSWGGPVIIGPNTGVWLRSHPQVALNSGGDSVAVWVQYDGMRESIYASHSVAGGSFGAPTPIETIPKQASYPQVVIDDNGNAIAVWREWDGITGIANVYANQYVAGTRWNPTPTLLQATPTDDALAPQLAMDGSENAIAVWSQEESGVYNLYARRYTVDAGWDPTPTLLETNPGNALAPQVAFDGHGNAVVVWSQGWNDIYAKKYEAGRGWGTTTLVEMSPGNTSLPNLAVDINGDAIVVWRQYDMVSSKWNIYANRYIAGRDWGTPTIIGPDSGEYAEPHIAVDAGGNAIAVWAKIFDATRYDIYFNKHVAGADWGTTSTLLVPNVGDTPGLEVAMDGIGNAIVVWRQMEGMNYSIRAKRYVSGGDFGETHAIGPGSDYARFPKIAMDSRGSAIVVWLQREGSIHNVYANRFE